MAASTLDPTNVVVLVGELSAAPRRRELPSGDIVVEFDVTTRGDAGTCSVPVAWFAAGQAATSSSTGTSSTISTVMALAGGSPVAVVGKIRRRFFRAAGATQSRTEVVAERVVPGAKPKPVERLKAQVAELLIGASSP